MFLTSAAQFQSLKMFYEHYMGQVRVLFLIVIHAEKDIVILKHALVSKGKQKGNV